MKQEIEWEITSIKLDVAWRLTITCCNQNIIWFFKCEIELLWHVKCVDDSVEY